MNVGSIPAMSAEQETAYIERYARDEYTGRGEIVDLGCWMGATTVAIARGLEGNARPAATGRKVHAFDRFVWESWMDQFVVDTPLGGRYRPGDSFSELFLANTAEWGHRVESHAGDLLRPDWAGQPVEFLFVDAMKSWELAHSIALTFFPCLLPGVSTVMHQDFCHFGTYWIHLVMYRLRRYFEPVCDLKDAWSVVFKCREAIPAEVFAEPVTLGSFSPDELDAAFAHSAGMVSPDKRAQLVGAHAIALLHAGRRAEARRLVNRAVVSGVSPADRTVPLGLLFGSTLLDYFAAVAPESTPSPTPVVAAPSPNETAYTGERHVPGLAGLACADLIHMLRYAYAAPLVAGRTVLDIACGSGYGCQYLAAHGAANVVGVDNSSDAIQYARLHYGSPSVRYVEGDAVALATFPAASFDMIVSFETIEHLESPSGFLAELRRLLRPGGILMLSCPNDAATPAWRSEFHRRTFRFDEFRDLVMAVFGEARFLGQYHLLGSCLVGGTAGSPTASTSEPFRQPLPPGHFGAEYLSDLTPLETANGYLAVVGVEDAEVNRAVACSQAAFRELVGGIHYLQSEAVREKAVADEERRRGLVLQTDLSVARKERSIVEGELANARNELSSVRSELSNVRSELALEQATVLSRLNRAIARMLGRR